MVLKCNSVIYLLWFYSHHSIAALVRLILWFCKWFLGKQDDLLNWSKQAFVFARKLCSTHIWEMHLFSFTPSLTSPSSQSRKQWSQGQALSIISIEVKSSQFLKLTWLHCNQKLPKGSVCTTAADLQTGSQSEEEEEEKECQWWWWWFYHNSGFANSNSIRDGGTRVILSLVSPPCPVPAVLWQ